MDARRDALHPRCLCSRRGPSTHQPRPSLTQLTHPGPTPKPLLEAFRCGPSNGRSTQTDFFNRRRLIGEGGRTVVTRLDWKLAEHAVLDEGQIDPASVWVDDGDSLRGSRVDGPRWLYTIRAAAR